MNIDSRGWIGIGVFALVFYILTLIALDPQLASNDLFKDLSIALVTTAFVGGVIGFYFGTSRSSVDKDQTIKDQLAANKGNPDGR